VKEQSKFQSRTNVFLVYEGGLDEPWPPGMMREWVLTHDDVIDYTDPIRMQRLINHVDGLILQYYGCTARSHFRVFYNNEPAARAYRGQLIDNPPAHTKEYERI
jgi:hypothetical protein